MSTVLAATIAVKTFGDVVAVSVTVDPHDLAAVEPGQPLQVLACFDEPERAQHIAEALSRASVKAGATP